MAKNGRKLKTASYPLVTEQDDVVLAPETISSLTKRIEDKLRKPQNGKSPQKKENEPRVPGKTGVWKNTGKGSGSIGQQTSEPELSETNAAGGAGAKLVSHGMKRLRDGQVKDVSHGEVQVNGAYKKQGNHKGSTNDRARLEEEVLALGGTEDDLKLIEDDVSESEFEGDAATSKETANKGLKKELLRFAQELGIDKVSQQADASLGSDQEEDFDAAPNKSDEASGSIRKDLVASKKPKLGKGAPEYEVEPTPEWYGVALPSLTSLNAKVVALPPDLVNRVHEYAKALLNAENKRYASQTGSANSAQQFYSTIMSSGTLSDKISALTLSVQESPLHNVRALEALVGLARKRSRGQAVEVLGALKDLFGIGSVLPPDRKLRTFASQPDLSAAFMSKLRWTPDDALPKSLTKAHLILWAFEDWLKALYFEVLKILETWCNDEVVFARGRAVDYVCQLLKERPEQEANLLRLLVNKLGDNDKKIASKTSYHILQLETAHPLMKPTIISSIESDLLFRPGQSLHAQYYATITLNQTVLSGKEEAVAKKLLDIYFSLFAKLLAKPQATKPTVSEANAIKLNQKGEVQGGGGPAGKAARRKAELKEKSTTVDDDLREKMLSAVLTGVNRAVPYSNTNDEVFEQHMDTLFRITHSSNFNTSIQALMLIQQLTETHPGSVDRFYRTLYESLLDPRLLTSSKQALYLNLLFKSLRSDLSIKRVKAFAKRLLQVVSMHQPAFACGAVYLLRELEGMFANLSAFVDDGEEHDTDEEEVFQDVHESDTDNDNNHLHPSHNGITPANPKKNSKDFYDPRKRDPEHSNASRSSLWELLPFTTHYHPSVSLFASRLLTHAPMPPKPDLQSHTLIHFLDRFVYRNPKTTSSARGASIMQPLPSSSFSGSTLLVSAAPSFRERGKQPVNTEAFWKQEADGVRADEVFFHKYFSKMGKGRERARGKKDGKKKSKGEGGSDDDDEEEEEIWKALVGSRMEDGEGEEGFEDGDSDMDVDGLLKYDYEDHQADEDEGGKPDTKTAESDNDDNDDNIPNFNDEEDDDDALLDSDADIPSDLDTAFQKEVQPAKQPEAESGSTKNKERRRKRMKLKQLPTFASAEEYAGMLDGEEDGEEG